MPEVHSLLSPSASHRWMSCPASVRLSKDIPSKTSKYAKEGTAVHKIIELSIKNNVSPLSFRRKTVEDVVITDAMSHNACRFVEYFNMHHIPGQDIAESELWVDLKFLGITGLDGGTADGVLVTKDSITVMDYKNGSGVKVESNMNTQLLCYAVGLVHMFPGRKEITLVIIQPNVCEEPIEWTISTAEVMIWCKYVLVPKGKACLDILAPCCPSVSACRFCPYAGYCKAYYNSMNLCTRSDFTSDVILPEVESLTQEQKERVVYYGDMIRNFIEAVENSVKDDLMRGIAGYSLLKLVRKNTRRKLKEDALDDVTSPLWDVLTEDEAYTKKPRALSELEKAIKKVSDKDTAKKIIDSITEKPEGELVVVSYEDKRMAVEPLTSEFTKIGE